MVDSGSIHPESVIDLASRQRERLEAAEGRRPPAPVAAPDDSLLALPFLLSRLEAPSEQVRMWAAYHLVDRWQDSCEEFVDRMFAARLPDVRESAINLIGKYRLQRFAFPLLRLLTANEDGLRPAAGMALARLQYEPAARALHAWYERMMAEQEANNVELEAAVESLLRFNNRRTWHEVFQRLEEHQQHHANFTRLFKQLCAQAETDEQVEALAAAYGKPREIFHDFHLTGLLVDLVGRANVLLYLQSRMNNGYPLPAVYHESLAVLGVELHDPQTVGLIEKLGSCHNNRAGVERYLGLAHALLPRLVREPARVARMTAFLRGCATWAGRWEEAILKVREADYFLLLSLPLVAVLQEVEEECLREPEREAVRIARLYQSPLLSPLFMRKVLNLMAHRFNEPELRVLRGTPLSGWLRDDEKDTLWKLFTRQLDEVDYPFEQALPQPWDYRLPALMERLLAALRPRFETYLADGRAQAVDYSLELFRRQGGVGIVPLLLRHFKALLTHHYDGFIEIMTHLPDERFLEPLLQHHREGEVDLERLIRFICDVHQRPYPERLGATPEPAPAVQAPTLARLYCPACGSAYQYAVGTLYVDLERIEQRQVPTARDLWAPEALHCKKCAAPVPFEPLDQFLQDLYAELLATRVLHVSNRKDSALKHVQLIPFPVLEGRTMNPRDFLMEVQRALGDTADPAQQVPSLLELGRFHLELGQLAEAREALQRILGGPVRSPLALYYLGIIAFQEQNLYEARVHFSRLLASCTRDDFDNALDNPLDMARHYLKLLDKRDVKRLHFHIVSS